MLLSLPNNQTLFLKPCKALLVIVEAPSYLGALRRTCSKDFQVDFSLVAFTHVHCLSTEQ